MSCENCPNRDYCIPDECLEEQKKDRSQRQLRTAKKCKNISTVLYHIGDE